MSQYHKANNSAQHKRHREQVKRARPACYICGKAIDYSLPRYDPGSFVLDHLVPLSRGGADTLENKAAAHWACNDAKRARDYAPIVRRSGSVA